MLGSEMPEHLLSFFTVYGAVPVIQVETYKNHHSSSILPGCQQLYQASPIHGGK